MKTTYDTAKPLQFNEWQMLSALTVISLSLVALRVFYTENLSFVFLVWNLFLAWIPWGISKAFIQPSRHSAWIKWLAVIPWLLFLPNSPYIITDLFHLRPRNDVPQWFDLILIFTNAWTGLLLAFCSFRHVQKELLNSAGRLRGQVATAFLWFTIAFGVYVGRFLRWNSWDVITRPKHLIRELLEHVFHPMAHQKAVGFTLFFGMFLYIAYLAWQMRKK